MAHKSRADPRLPRLRRGSHLRRALGEIGWMGDGARDV